MSMSFEKLYSESAKVMKASEIRELLKLTQRSEIISFAGGLPNPDAFPIDKMKPIINHVMDRHARDALQYGATEGHNKLRKALVKGMNETYDVDTNINNVLVTHGSQQALSLLSHVFIDPGDKIITAAPTYLGATVTFNSFRAQMECVPINEDGIQVDLLEDKLDYMAWKGEKAKFLYLIPTFQNPSGVTIPEKNRRKIYDLACEHDLLIIEDDPYGLLRFEGEKVPVLKSMDDESRVVYLGTFSKILAPGMRIAWMVAPDEIANKVGLAKQAQDLCANPFSQYCIFEAIHNNILFPHIDVIIDIYKEKRDLMLQAMNEYFPIQATWNKPQGGLFIWVTLPPSINTNDMFPTAVANNVAYVVGHAFFPDGTGYNTMRLNFSHPSNENIEEGIKRLGAVIEQELEKQQNELPKEVLPGV